MLLLLVCKTKIIIHNSRKIRIRLNYPIKDSKDVIEISLTFISRFFVRGKIFTPQLCRAYEYNKEGSRAREK